MGNKRIPVNPVLAERIILARKAKGVKQKDLAEMLGVSDQVIRSYELCRVGVSKAMAIAIATVLECNAQYFLDENITDMRPLHKNIEAYKGIARVCFNSAKQSNTVEKALMGFGLNIDRCPINDVLFHCELPMREFTPDYVYEGDEWWQDFWDMDKFDEFWKKWYETTERSF